MKAHRERQDAELERAMWESEHPEEAAKKRAELEEWKAQLHILADVITPPVAREEWQRVQHLKLRADRCAQCNTHFASDDVIYRRRGGWDHINDPVLPFCANHRCRQLDGYHNRDAPEGRYYPRCSCEERHWDEPSPCIGCGRLVSHPKCAAWRRPRGWSYEGEVEPNAPRVFCGSSCKNRVLTAEKRAHRNASRLKSAICVVCERQFAPNRSDSRYCCAACRQRSYRQRQRCSS